MICYLQLDTLEKQTSVLDWIRGVLLAICWIACPSASAQVVFNDATETAGIAFIHEDGADDEGFLPSLMASGLALFDFDKDGAIDIYLLSGRPLNTPDVASPKSNQLYRNIGNLQFSSAPIPAIAIEQEFSLGVAVADIDNDGFQDLAVSNLGSVSLLKNMGDGSFEDITAEAGLGTPGIAFGAGVAFLDLENDGDLDLYVADYVQFSMEQFKQLAPASFPYPPGPEHFQHRSDHIFLNTGDGTFVDASIACGISDFSRPSMGVTCGDFDDDDDTDIFVCCDARPNLLFLNDGKGNMTQEAELFGVAYNATGTPVGSMGAEPGDIDNDGLEDLFITDYSGQLPILFRNLGGIGFEDFSRHSRSGREVLPHANWGAGLFDFDNDGDRDLMIGNGHLLKWANRIEQLTSFKVLNTLLLNNGQGQFTRAVDDIGNGLQILESTRGLGFDDLDNDGDIDCVALNSDSRASLLENRSTSSGNWIDLDLVGTSFNRDAVGAKVTIQCGDSTQFSEVHSGRGYQSHYGSRLHFGVGKHATIERIQIDWLGKTTEYHNLPANQLHTLLE